MFNFGRKREDKDKKRKDKKERQKKFLDGGMTQQELSRLSELTKKQTSPDKLPSGITADYRLLNDDNGAEKIPRPTSLPPPLPERPPPKMKKSILKSSQSYDVTRSVSSDLDDPQVLLRNTKQNELYAYRKSLLAAQQREREQQQYAMMSSPSTNSTSSANTEFQASFCLQITYLRFWIFNSFIFFAGSRCVL